MAASQVFLVIFVVIFLGFISLLVSMRQAQTVKPEYDDTDDDDNTNDTDIMVEISRPYDSHCKDCPVKSLRDIFCDPGKFAAVLSINSLLGAYGKDRMYSIKLLSQLKQYPDVNTSSIGTANPSIKMNAFPVSCEPVTLKMDRDYILTGRIETKESTGVALVDTCDILIDWTSLRIHRKRSLFSFFSPKLRC